MVMVFYPIHNLSKTLSQLHDGARLALKPTTNSISLVVTKVKTYSHS
jgi:hypothetical protein